jgi:aspartate aminotransferase-like enzyme
MKRYLLTPGPTPVPSEALLAMVKPAIYHRGPEFKEVLTEVKEGLKYLFQTNREVYFFTSSGTGSMEAAVCNFLCSGDKVLVVQGGKFGERWRDICLAYGLQVDLIDVEWGKAVDPEEIASRLKEDPNIKAVFVQFTESSTGVKHDVERIAQITAPLDQTLLIVDAITGIGVYKIEMDAWKLDVLITGSQKALMIPPGLSFICVSDKAWRFAERSNLPKYYFDLRKEKKAQDKNENAYTPAVPLVMALRETLRLIRTEGLDQVVERHARLAEATRAAIQALGLELFAPESPSNAVTAVKSPEGLDSGRLIKHLREKYGITLAGGQDRLKGKIFRIAHLGFADRFDVITAIAGLEMALYDLGYPIQLSAGVRAAQERLLK